MKNLKEYINESNIRPQDITNYIESWLKDPMKSKDMYNILGAIVQGAKNAYEYRTDPKYLDDNKQYAEASEVLAKFIEQLK